MKKIRLITTYKCPKDCELCCNKGIAVTGVPSIPKFTTLGMHNDLEEVILTGGEPRLYEDELFNLVKNIKNNGLKVYLYTALAKPTLTFFNTIIELDGLTLTLHEIEDWQKFFELDEMLERMGIEHDNLRLHVMNTAWLPNEKLMKPVFGQWKAKYMRYVEDCPVNEDETLMELKNLWTKKK